MLGAAMQRFVKKTCAAYDTRELPHEMAARGRRKAAMIKKGLDSGKNISVTTFALEKLRKILNLVTYKYHALSDYIGMILRFETTDSYSTQVGELAHKVVKCRYDCTNKNNFVPQLARHDARECLLHKVAKQSDEHRRRELVRTRRQKCKWPERLPLSDPTAHYHIAISIRKHLNVRSWIHDHPGDPVLKEFLPRLKDHLLAHMLGLAYNGDKYVTVLSQEDGTPDNPMHPYWYARVVGIFHCMVHHHGHSSEPKQLDFLWVRWFGLDTDAPGGWDLKWLHSVAFIPEDNPAAFGFLDPKQIIRGIHLIPAFARGHTSEQLGPSISRQPAENDEDWEGYYINMFVDHDMFMRFGGGGIGHKGTWHPNTSLLQDGQAAQVPEEPFDEGVDEQGGTEDDDSEEESEEEKGEEGPLTEEEEEEDSDNDPDPLPKGDGRERDKQVLAEEGYGKF
ncbi:hypothetical protein HETIRDRAFT_430757 [Heterobasidion irregulare TC 32-1]|uniref:Uncharacterized protein n=1 Tax=Heterobasidion irregulare (strain TC 32-1) TaxID=747525 RepID=W4JPG2_HETIT|nr:uncharacterized protein HETIRDRAFT_430757 [Heterobasidion irregulare TC 32-1]ETW75354.1 hypothetical protein HETIRDRAFT_430757 [Heterobasidion irregulare TC 32-1]